MSANEDLPPLGDNDSWCGPEEETVETESIHIKYEKGIDYKSAEFAQALHVAIYQHCTTGIMEIKYSGYNFELCEDDGLCVYVKEGK